MNSSVVRATLLSFALVALPALRALAATYHVDSAAGDDARDGLTPATAWRTLARVSAQTFAPGDAILLRAGAAWSGEMLHPRGSGKPDALIRVGRYGDGLRPALHGGGRVPAVVRLENQQHWEIADLEITNRAPDGPQPLRGVELRARDAGVVRQIVLRRLLIHDINAPFVYEDSNVVAKSYGGIATLIEGNAVPTAWDGLLVEGCEIRDVSAIGMTMVSAWTKGHRANDPATWFPSRNVAIRGNVFQRTARNGLVVRACAGAVVEHNLFRECAISGSGNASFAFHSDDTVFQYNEACYTKFNPGDHDAAGFDSDYNCRRTVFQYNYSHHNDYGFILLCNNGRSGFNEDTIVRYNISYRDGGNVIRFSGPVTGARIHNNTLYISPDMTNPREGHPPRVIYHKSWSGWSDDAVFSNNLIVNRSERTVYDPGQSTNNRYSHNVFAGLRPASEPADPQATMGEVRLAAPELAGAGRASAAAAFRLHLDSAAAGAGWRQPTQGAADFAGQPVFPLGERVDAGAIQLSRW